MALDYIAVTDQALGVLKFIKHRGTLQKTILAGRRNRRVPEFEVYEIESSIGQIFSVKIPSRQAVKGDFFGEAIKLANPKLVNVPLSIPDAFGGFNVVSRLVIEAEKIEIGGKA